MEPIYTPEIPKPAGHYTPAMKHNGMIYLSGQLPIHPETKEIPETIEGQTMQALSNVK